MDRCARYEGGHPHSDQRGVLEAIDPNEPKLAQKADLLFYAGLCMLAALTGLTGYFIYSSVT